MSLRGSNWEGESRLLFGQERGRSRYVGEERIGGIHSEKQSG
jgi:hypothetical protein